MNNVSIQSGLIVFGVLLIVIVAVTVITFAAYYSGGYIALAMLISLTLLIAGALMITQHPEWLMAPKTKDQGMQAWIFVLFIVSGVLGIGISLFGMIETMKRR